MAAAPLTNRRECRRPLRYFRRAIFAADAADPIPAGPHKPGGQLSAGEALILGKAQSTYPGPATSGRSAAPSRSMFVSGPPARKSPPREKFASESPCPARVVRTRRASARIESLPTTLVDHQCRSGASHLPQCAGFARPRSLAAALPSPEPVRTAGRPVLTGAEPRSPPRIPTPTMRCEGQPPRKPVGSLMAENQL